MFENFLVSNTVEFNTKIKHSLGEFKNKLIFNFKGEKEGACGYDTVQENTNTISAANGIQFRAKVKPKLLQFQVDFPRRSLFQPHVFSPYVRVEVSRGQTNITPFLGAVFFFPNFKFNVVSSHRRDSSLSPTRTSPSTGELSTSTPSLTDSRCTSQPRMESASRTESSWHTRRCWRSARTTWRCRRR